MTNPIEDFLNSRRILREKKPGERNAEQIQSEFSLPNWLESAAMRASQLSLVTHPGKFSHPDVDVASIRASPRAEADGFLRSGNVTDVPFDVLGNAAALDVYAFLSLVMDDGRTVLEHFEASSTTLQNLLQVDDEVFGRWREGLLKIKEDQRELRSDGKAKQVYFPVFSDATDPQYHLLTILTASGIVNVNRDRIRDSKFSDEVKQARENRKNNQLDPKGYDDFSGLLIMKFGGSQPQNVSRLNSTNTGQAYLFSSLPPLLDDSYIAKPKRDFFKELRWNAELKEYFTSMHQLLAQDYNNVNIRDGMRYWRQQICDWVFERASILQSLDPEWTTSETNQLPIIQKRWLDPKRDWDDSVVELDEWHDEIVRMIVVWMVSTYRRMFKAKGVVLLGEVHEVVFASELSEYIASNYWSQS